MAVLLSQCKWNNVIVSWYHDSNGDFCNSVLFKSPNIFNKDGLRPWFSSTHPFWSLYRPSYVQLRRNVYQLDTHFSWVQQNWFKLKSYRPPTRQSSPSCPEWEVLHAEWEVLNEKSSTTGGVFSKQLSRRRPTQGYPGGSPKILQVKSVLILTCDSCYIYFFFTSWDNKNLLAVL